MKRNKKIVKKTSKLISPREMDYELMVEELVDQIDTCHLGEKKTSSLHKAVAHFSEAYFFYNHSGDFCLLTC